MCDAMGCLLPGVLYVLRSGELTQPGGVTFDPDKRLSPSDVTVDNVSNPTSMRIHLKCSKTDQTRAGMDFFVGRTFNALCPVVAMLHYLSMRGFSVGPLFCWKHGSPLMRPAFVEKVRGLLQVAGVDASHYAGHSFHISAATTAAANGVGDATIQMLRRW